LGAQGDLRHPRLAGFRRRIPDRGGARFAERPEVNHGRADPGGDGGRHDLVPSRRDGRGDGALAAPGAAGGSGAAPVLVDGREGGPGPASGGDNPLRRSRCRGPARLPDPSAGRPLQLFGQADHAQLGARSRGPAGGGGGQPRHYGLAHGRGDPAAPMRAADNPFAVRRVLAIRYRLSGETWEGLLERLAALRYRAAIVGPHGRGKTTLLEDLAPRLEALGFRTRTVTLHTGNRFFTRDQRE